MARKIRTKNGWQFAEWSRDDDDDGDDDEKDDGDDDDEMWGL